MTTTHIFNSFPAPGPMLSPSDYHWAYKRGDTTARSILYALAGALVLIGLKVHGTAYNQWWFLALLGLAAMVALGFTKKRTEGYWRPSLIGTLAGLVNLAVMIAIFSAPTLYYDPASLLWRAPLLFACMFIYARFFGPGAQKVPGQPGRPAAPTHFDAEPYLTDSKEGRP